MLDDGPERKRREERQPAAIKMPRQAKEAYNVDPSNGSLLLNEIKIGTAPPICSLPQWDVTKVLGGFSNV